MPRFPLPLFPVSPSSRLFSFSSFFLSLSFPPPVVLGFLALPRFLVGFLEFSFSSLGIQYFHSVLDLSFAMAAARAAVHSDAPWETPDPLSCVQQLQALLGQGLNIDHDSTGDLQVLMHSALGGIRKEVDQHMDLLETEHVEHKTDPQYQRKMVRFWKCSSVTLHPSKTYNLGDSELDLNQVYFQWARMQNLPGWWVKKIWHSHEGWLLVATKEEFNLLIPDVHPSVDQRNLMEETLSSESSMEQQRQNMRANLARQALQHFLHPPEDDNSTRDRSRSPRGNEDMPYLPAASVHRDEAGLLLPNNDEVTMPPAL